MDGTIRNLIRVGRISSINKNSGICRCVFDDKDNLVSDELCIMEFVDLSTLEVGKQVLCVFLPNGLQQGFCLGSFYSDINIPIQGGTS